jgi:hypothetical protein
MTLIVETGAGLSTAESYISVADATSYFLSFGGSDAWSSLDDQEVALRRASRDLDTLYGASFPSTLLNSSQALLFPRTPFTDRNGRNVSGVPPVLGYATAELALLNASSDATGPASEAGNVKSKRIKAEGVEKQVEYFSPSSATSSALRKVNLLLSPYLNGSSMSFRVVRG